MKIITIISLLLIPIITGLIIRILVKNKPKFQLLAWGILMISFISFSIYSLTLIMNQVTPLFTPGHMANEVTLLSTVCLFISGCFYYKRNKSNLTGKWKWPLDCIVKGRSPGLTQYVSDRYPLLEHCPSTFFIHFHSLSSNLNNILIKRQKWKSWFPFISWSYCPYLSS